MNLDWETIPIYRTVTSIDEFMEAMNKLLLNGYWIAGFDGHGVVMRDSLGYDYNVLGIDIPADDDSEEFDALGTWLENILSRRMILGMTNEFMRSYWIRPQRDPEPLFRKEDR